MKNDSPNDLSAQAYPPVYIMPWGFGWEMKYKARFGK